MSATTNWKNSEKLLAKLLQEVGLPARRLSRGDNFSLSIPDVEIENHPYIMADSKYSRQKPFRHHGLIREIQTKYCKKPGDEPLLFTKNFREHSGFITIRAEFFAELLKHYPGRANG